MSSNFFLRVPFLMRRLLLQWGHRSGGLIRERRCAARGVRGIDEGDVSPRLGSIRRQRTIRGIEYAKGRCCGGRRICKVVAGFIGRRICKVVGVVGSGVAPRDGRWFLGTPPEWLGSCR